MADHSAASIDRGQTLYGRTGTIDTANYGTSVGLEGFIRRFPNTDPNTTETRRNGGDAVCIFVRNVSGITLIPGLLVSWQASYVGRRVDGYCDTTADPLCAGIVDDHYNATAGIRNGDMFWLVIQGDVLVHTPVAGSSFAADWAANDWLYALTADGSTATTTGGSTANEAGRLQKFNTAMTATSTQTTDGTLTKILVNRVGFAVSAATTNETSGNTLKLIHVCLNRWN